MNEEQLLAAIATLTQTVAAALETVQELRREVTELQAEVRQRLVALEGQDQ